MIEPQLHLLLPDVYMMQQLLLLLSLNMDTTAKMIKHNKYLQN